MAVVSGHVYIQVDFTGRTADVFLFSGQLFLYVCVAHVTVYLFLAVSFSTRGARRLYRTRKGHRAGDRIV